jgi:two-component system NtrC family sensor kinase
MKKTVFLIFTFCVLLELVNAQQKYVDSLKRSLLTIKQDSDKIKTYTQIGNYYQWSFPDSSLYYLESALQMAKKLSDSKQQFFVLLNMEEPLSTRGNYSKALQVSLQALTFAETLKNSMYIAWAWEIIGHAYYYSGDYQNALTYYNKLQLNAAYIKRNHYFLSGFIGETYYHLNNLDSAFSYIVQCYRDGLKQKGSWVVPYFYLGKIYERKGDHKKAIYYSKIGIDISAINLDKADGYNYLAIIYKNYGRADSSIFYAKRALSISINSSLASQLIDASSILTALYKSRHLPDSALKYQNIMLTAKDSVFSREKIKEMQNFSFNERMRQQVIVEKQERHNNRIKMYSAIFISAILLLLAIILWRNNRLKQKANDNIQNMLNELRRTQTQLIQSEKMASLGELTAGIAHEIQNPLNFVNNFAEVNIELLDEMETELKSGDKEEALAIASDVKQNLEKIRHHGQRADGIVKGMLQHSRASSNTKEPTDVNKLADEYLRLAYHGLRAKDKNFNAELETNFDPKLPPVNLVPQDIGRVLLNLFTNAFYATEQRKKLATGNYSPVVKVSTAKIGDNLEIKVRDNGNGIPEDIRDKIMQPFFTTKPTGEGTGLGLSMSYDIVVKGHGGSIQIESNENEYTEFIILIPI